MINDILVRIEFHIQYPVKLNINGTLKGRFSLCSYLLNN